MDKTVLILDDQDTLVIGRFLEDWGVDFITADSVDSAFEVMKDTLPDLIFVDLLLGPDAEDGITFLQKRAAIPWLKRIPVLMLSGRGDLDTIYEAFRFGANGFVIKPVVKNILREKLVEFHLVGREKEDNQS